MDKYLSKSHYLLFILFMSVAIVSFGVCQTQNKQSYSQEGVIHTTAIRAPLDSLGKVVSRASRTGDAGLYASTRAKNGGMSGAGNPRFFR